uniref:LuxE/PaaK family acyltransferase n=1 Tax=Clostridium sp. NkU-1 TaxID=1095009 RepID=UPI000AB51ABA
MNLDMERIRQFLDRYTGKRILIFGFTYMIWKYFYQALAKSGQKLDIPEGILIHGGGFKKLEDQSVSAHEFKERIREVSGIKEIHNYYGMAEQTGSIYVECSQGHLHASLYSDIITRRVKDFGVCSHGEKGIIQVLSPLALSYPGHSILTEDEGIILGEDDCPCGRLGKYFKVFGRIRQAEIRGCSDTYDG